MISYTGDCHITFARPKGLAGLDTPFNKMLNAHRDVDVAYDYDDVQYQRIEDAPGWFTPTWLACMRRSAIKSHLTVLKQETGVPND